MSEQFTRGLFHAHTHKQKITIMIFFSEILELSLQHKLFFSFHWLITPTAFATTLMTNSLFAQNVLELTFVL